MAQKQDDCNRSFKVAFKEEIDSPIPSEAIPGHQDSYIIFEQATISRSGWMNVEIERGHPEDAESFGPPQEKPSSKNVILDENGEIDTFSIESNDAEVKEDFQETEATTSTATLQKDLISNEGEKDAQVSSRAAKRKSGRKHPTRNSDQEPHSCGTNPHVLLELKHLSHSKEKPSKSNTSRETSSCRYMLRNRSHVEKPSKCNESRETPNSGCLLKNRSREPAFECSERPTVFTTERPFECNSCPKKFKMIHHLKQHLAVHSNEKLWKCHVCQKSFAFKFSLKRHLLIHSEIKPFVCNDCDKSFINSYDLNQHLRVHSGERPFICTQCHKTFTRKNHLKEHSLLHLGEKSYKCNECHKIFNRKYLLNRHLLVHSEKKTFKCNECDKKFKMKHHLKQHSLGHLNVRAFKCDQCQKTFPFNYSLKRHLSVHLK